MAQIFQELTVNFSAKKARHDTLHGKDYLVVPAVALTEGVHPGNNGPIFYGKDELAERTSKWDHKPIVVYHPKKDGQFTSACTPAALEARGCGIMLNTLYDDKLRTECWFDVEKTKLVDPRVYEALEKEQLTEVSTGLFLDVVMEEGEFNGVPYKFRATNFAPDHLAILPDKVGACSIEKGAGLFQVNEESPIPLTVNERIHQKIHRALQDALDTQFGYTHNINDTYNDFFIHSDGKGNLHKRSYSIDKDGKATLGTEATPVDWVKEYRTKDGTFVGNSRVVPVKEIEVDKKALVDGLITANVGWEESDRPTLDAMSDAKLKTLFDKSRPAAPAPAPAPAPAITAPAITVDTPKPVSLTEFIANQAPPELRDPLMQLVTNGEKQKSAYVKVISESPKNRFTKEWLQDQRLEVLENMASMVGSPTTNGVLPNYAGAATIPGTVTVNEVDQEPLEEITMTFGK